eukprot:CAMPEP_0179041788 /NCGR_PEP_ID=MMETSP0796-20121207/16335_1 /TAXON_ID=73915 /ORGANISM="Pyrodinium bahamense, Strain pbaha01" /LENGTH=115 /DNA_ID=CAMNT_0020738159 /DNA_START=74 /DNA_END=421 /DNA_ORIENTATION=+
MGLLRAAARLAATPLAQTAALRLRAPVAAPRAALSAFRGFASRSAPRLGHNLEDHYDMAEFMCKMHSPLGEYLIWGVMFSTFFVTFGPMMHSNYYFTGRFLPKDQGNTQLCDDSW